MKIRSTILSVALAATLGACGTTGVVKPGSTMPGPYNGLGGDPMPMLMVHMNPYVADHVSGEQYSIVIKLAGSCFKDYHEQVSGTGEAMASSGTVSGILGAGGGASITKFVPGSTVGVYAPYVGTLNAFNGAGNGLLLSSQNTDSVVGSCVNGDLQDDVLRDRARGLHTYTSLLRTRNTSDPKKTPSWVMPEPPPE